MQIIDNDEEMGRWQAEGRAAVARRRVVLARARARLTGPQPPRRNIPLPRRTSLQPGDVLAYRATEHRYVLLRVARIDRNEPVCVLLDFAGVRIPAIGDIAAMPHYLWVDRWTPDGRVVPITMQAYKRIDYAQGGYVLIGNIGTRPGDDQLEPGLIWDWQAALISSTLVRLLVER